MEQLLYQCNEKRIMNDLQKQIFPTVTEDCQLNMNKEEILGE